MTEENNQSPFSILFVDDEENARKYFVKGLKHDFSVLTAASVAQAKEVLNEKHREIAVVVTDQRMPGGNGVELLTFLKDTYPHIIRLLTTAYSDLDDAIAAVNTGEILRYIQKPWDYIMLKSEMKQAMELFELRLEKNNMLHEKLMIKKKMAKVERVKDLILFSKTVSFVNYADIAIANYIKEFSAGVENFDANGGWESFDLGNADLLETKFLAAIIDKIQQEIPVSTDYGFDKHINAGELQSLIAGLNWHANVTISDDFMLHVNQQLFSSFLKNLSNIAALSAATASVTAHKADGKISINLDVEHIDITQNANIFTASPNGAPDQFYIDLLACYIAVGHHGGLVKYAYHDNKLSLEITLPADSSNFHFIEDARSDMDDVILCAML